MSPAQVWRQYPVLFTRCTWMDRVAVDTLSKVEHLFDRDADEQASVDSVSCRTRQRRDSYHQSMAAYGAQPVLSIRSELWSFWTHGRRVERLGYAAGALLIASGVIHIALLLGSGASWDGPLSLRKAITFGLSFGLTSIAIAWVTSFLLLRDRTRTMLLGAFTAACVLETALVSLQVWRGVPSHFNLETTFDGLVARTLAAGGATLVAVIGALAVAAFRADPRLPLSLRIAIRAGFAALVCAMAVGGLMIAKGMLLVVSGNPQAAYAMGGTLRPTHFAMMHGILLLPGLAWLLSFADWTEARRLRLVLAAVFSYALFAGAIAAGNLGGLDLLSLPFVTSAGLGAAGLLATAIVAVRAVRDPVTSSRTHQPARAS